MKLELVERLNQINREFYSTFADSFSETRASARELQVILPYIGDGARVLDIGCGNGRVAVLLAHERQNVTYVGVDASVEQISNVKSQISPPHKNGRQALKSPDARFVVADIMQPDWTDSLSPQREETGMREFDCILLLAVLHHIPDSEARARILRQVRELLAPQGRAVVSTWQFMDNERMRKKIVPWSSVGVDEHELEPGDALLSWKRDGEGLRYCHWIGEDEIRALAAQTGLSVVDTFRAGGREGNLSLYAVLSSS
jgi:2-polyprenyl-3-methyl-5-hydroxy-6-metoxy-1,4-benzoquinol methylase